MKSLIRCAGAFVAASAITTAAAAQNNGHAHVGHVADSFRDTPDNVGLLAAARMEAEVAGQHAGLAARSGSLDALKRHIGHVMNALDPAAMAEGPGKGFGMIKAAQGAATHVGLAARADGASDNLKRHAEHVGASATNVAEWGAMALDKARAVMQASDQAAAKEMAEELVAMMHKILSGNDANGDGRIGWGPSEGGLEQAATHLNLLKQGEGLNN